MKRSAITPARLDLDADGLARAGVDDTHALRAGAHAQPRPDFLAANDLPARWAGAARHVILATAFGAGHAFLATWAAWRADPQRCERLVYLAIEPHPLTAADLARTHPPRGDASDALAAQLVAAWPLAMPDLHALDFDAGRVQLMLALGDLDEVLGGLHGEIDSVFLGGNAATDPATMGRDDVFKRIARLSRPGTRVAASGRAPALCRGLARHGFEVMPATGHDPDAGAVGGIVAGTAVDSAVDSAVDPAVDLFSADGSGSHLTPTDALLAARYAPRHIAAPPRGEAWPHAAER
ncbi:MAG: MnmC family methyltransferase, partial [Leptothrix sp. (in: b-proteobacteria)]